MNNLETASELSFEAAMQKLEAILEKMAAPNESLEDLLRHYEEGTVYLKICKARLSEAETKISILNEKLAKEASPGRTDG